jgi:epoxide hydrolase A/B
MSNESFETAHIIDTNGIRMAVYEQGSGNPVVLCHGFPELAFSWRHQMQPLADAGYHVLAPDQRGYGKTDRPDAVTDYDISHLTGDLVGLLDHYGYQDAVFVGHDWGAIVVWNLALLHPERVRGVINLSVPFMERGATEWVGFWEQHLGGDFYIVHFNRQPGVADAVFAKNPKNLLRNLYRTGQWHAPPRAARPGMPLINLVEETDPAGTLLMSEAELDVFADAFSRTGFTGGINWYRNFTRNWHILADVPQRVEVPALMIHGQYDIVPASANIKQHVPNVEVLTFDDCGHWIQQEKPAETNAAMLAWLARHYPA